MSDANSTKTPNGDDCYEVAADDVAFALAFSESSVAVLLGAGVVFEAGHDDDVQRSVGLPVAAAVESMASGFARRCG